jgi:hypothetical protein
MGQFAKEVERAIAVVGASAWRSERFTSPTVMEALRERFAARPIRRSVPIWEDLADDVSVQQLEAWRRIDEFCGRRRCLLSFNPDDETAAFEVEDGAEIPAVIAECFRFEFYVSDEAATFLLCFNHHDFLVAAGDARGWLRQAFSI